MWAQQCGSFYVAWPVWVLLYTHSRFKYMLGLHDFHMELLLCPTQVFQLAWLDGQSGIFPIHVPVLTQSALILVQCYLVQFTQILELNLNGGTYRFKQAWKD